MCACPSAKAGGRYMDNIFVERLWRSLKYEEVYLNAYASVAEAKAGIGSWLGFYNEERQHQSLGYRTPRQAYEAECRWICGRSASPTGCAFAHIPTGTTANHRIDIDEGEGRSNVMSIAPSAIGAGTEIGRGYTLENGSRCLAIGVHLRSIAASGLLESCTSPFAMAFTGRIRDIIAET